MTEIGLTTRERTCLVDITGEVEQVVAKSGVNDGLCTVFVPHTTAGVTLNENADPSVRQDILSKLAELAPHHGPYRHSEGNADAHIKAALVGSSVHVPIRQGRLAFGTWQGIFFCEFDGPRQRRIWVTLQPAP